MDQLKTWLFARIKEKSTWVGLITAAVTALGWHLAPEQAGDIATGAAAFAAAVLIGTKAEQP